MPHIVEGDSSVKEILKFVSLYGATEAKLQDGSYPDPAAIQKAQQKMLKRQEHICQLLQEANKEFEEATGLPEPD
jgi:hypothetical protein